MRAWGLHDDPSVMPGYNSCSQTLQARHFRIYRVCLNIKVRSRFVPNSLNDYLHVVSWAYELNKIAACIQFSRQWIPECVAPEPSLRLKVICFAVDDEVS
jgi:hypothetical protein